MKKPAVHFRSSGESGNIYAILAKVSSYLYKQKRIWEYNELRDKVYTCGNYEAALNAIRVYVDLVDLDGRY